MIKYIKGKLMIWKVNRQTKKYLKFKKQHEARMEGKW